MSECRPPRGVLTTHNSCREVRGEIRHGQCKTSAVLSVPSTRSKQVVSNRSDNSRTMRTSVHLLALILVVVFVLALKSGPFGDAVTKRRWSRLHPANIADFDRFRETIRSLKRFEGRRINSITPLAVREEEESLGGGKLREVHYFKTEIIFQDLPNRPFLYLVILYRNCEYSSLPSDPDPGFVCSEPLRFFEVRPIPRNYEDDRRKKRSGRRVSRRLNLLKSSGCETRM